MVADQWKKRLRAASTIDYSLDPRGLKKKKKKQQQGLERCGLKLRSNISLVWDDRKKCVLPKKEQIGISWRDLTPFLDSLPHHHSILADVFTVPHEIFEFENLSEVLSHKVWQANLSEDERGFLTQFFPEGSEPDEIFCKLLEEENFHFGNPFLKWGQMICSGSFHPDNVIRREQLFKANKKAYYMELQIYHENLIGNLQLWKENLESYKGSEEEMVEVILRSRKHAEKFPLLEPEFHGIEDDIVMTPESSSRHDKGCSNESLNILMLHGDIQRGKGFMEGTYGSSPDGAKAIARSRKGEKLNKRNIQHSDGAKYMSYIKVSREHYQRVKNSMKHNSNCIQPRSLSYVLGDVENLHVRPFEYYVEEERQKLHDHWLRLAYTEVPTGLANWIKRRSQGIQVRRSLGQELEQKLKVQTKGGEKNSSDGIFAELTDKKKTEEKRSSDAIFAELTDNKEAEERKRSSDAIFAEVTDNKEAEERSSDGIFAEVTDNKEADERSSDVIFAEVTDNNEAEERNSDVIFGEVTDNKEAEVAFSMKIEVEQHEGKEKSDRLIKKQMERELVHNELPLQSEDQEAGEPACLCDKKTPDSTGGESASLCDKETPDSTSNIDSDDESLPVSLNQDLHHVSLDDSNQLGHFKLDSNVNQIIRQADDVSPTVSEYPERLNNVGEVSPTLSEYPERFSNVDEVSPTVSEYPERLNNVDVPVDQGDLLASTGDGWPAVSIAASYGCATPISHEYSSAEQLSLGHSRVTDLPAASLINLEAVPTGKDAGRDMLAREPSDVSLFGSYPPQNRNEIFQPFFKGAGSSSYNHEQKQPLLDFQPSSSLMVVPSQYSGHFREQLHMQLPLEPRPKGLNDLFMHPNFQGNVYPDGGRYSFPRHEQLNIGMQDWAVNSVHVSAPPQSHLSSGDLLNQNWFSGENHARGGWSTLEGVGGPSQSIGSTNNSDQSLYSVLSECNELHQSGSYDISGSREQFIPSRNYGNMGVGIPAASNASQQPAKPISYMSSQESIGGLKPNGLGWASMSTQNPGLHDSMGKPFLRPWNP